MWDHKMRKNGFRLILTLADTNVTNYNQNIEKRFKIM